MVASHLGFKSNSDDQPCDRFEVSKIVARAPFRVNRIEQKHLTSVHLVVFFS